MHRRPAAKFVGQPEPGQRPRGQSIRYSDFEILAREHVSDIAFSPEIDPDAGTCRHLVAAAEASRASMSC